MRRSIRSDPECSTPPLTIEHRPLTARRLLASSARSKCDTLFRPSVRLHREALFETVPCSVAAFHRAAPHPSRLRQRVDGAHLAGAESHEADDGAGVVGHEYRSEEHTSELQSHSFISYAVFCLKKNKKK